MSKPPVVVSLYVSRHSPLLGYKRLTCDLEHTELYSGSFSKQRFLWKPDEVQEVVCFAEGCSDREEKGPPCSCCPNAGKQATVRCHHRVRSVPPRCGIQANRHRTIPFIEHYDNFIKSSEMIGNIGYYLDKPSDLSLSIIEPFPVVAKIALWGRCYKETKAGVARYRSEFAQVKEILYADAKSYPANRSYFSYDQYRETMDAVCDRLGFVTYPRSLEGAYL